MARWGRALAAKPGDLHSILRAYVVQGENGAPQRSSAFHVSMHVHTHRNKYSLKGFK